MNLNDKMPSLKKGELILRVEEDGKLISEQRILNKTLPGAGKAVCQLMKGETVSYQGLSYMGVGSGNASWSDDNPPEPPSNQDRLVNELGRVATQNAYIQDYTQAEILGTSNGSAGQTFILAHPPLIQSKTAMISEEMLGSSDGSPSQTFTTAFKPVSASSDELFIISGPSGSSPTSEQWTRVVDFTSSVSSSKHYTLSESTGIITFGDGVNGAIPAKGDSVKLNYIAQERFVYVGGVAWAEVSLLGNYGATDEVFTLDTNTGTITFGDGVNGKIPPALSVISADYRTSLPFTTLSETNWLQVVGVFPEGIADGTWRELGIFCNDNADQLNGGFMANCKNIAQINKLSNRKVTVVWRALFV